MKQEEDMLYIYITDAWCSNVVKVGGQCFPDVYFLMQRCRPFYQHFIVTNSKNALQNYILGVHMHIIVYIVLFYFILIFVILS